MLCDTFTNNHLHSIWKSAVMCNNDDKLRHKVFIRFTPFYELFLLFLQKMKGVKINKNNLFILLYARYWDKIRNRKIFSIVKEQSESSDTSESNKKDMLDRKSIKVLRKIVNSNVSKICKTKSGSQLKSIQFIKLKKKNNSRKLLELVDRKRKLQRLRMIRRKKFRILCREASLLSYKNRITLSTGIGGSNSYINFTVGNKIEYQKSLGLLGIQKKALRFRKPAYYLLYQNFFKNLNKAVSRAGRGRKTTLVIKGFSYFIRIFKNCFKIYFKIVKRKYKKTYKALHKFLVNKASIMKRCLKRKQRFVPRPYNVKREIALRKAHKNAKLLLFRLDKVEFKSPTPFGSSIYSAHKVTKTLINAYNN